MSNEELRQRSFNHEQRIVELEEKVSTLEKFVLILMIFTWIGAGVLAYVFAQL